jgi:hypothetical protein
MMTSERQIAANRRNALKSTGPRTVAGKARAARNALKHGLAGETDILPPEDMQLYKERLHGWKTDARPEGDIEAYLVATAALASVRVDRCIRNEFAVIARKRKRAVNNWEDLQTSKINEILASCGQEPADAVEELALFTRGCDWLLNEWSRLAESLETSGFWSPEQATQALWLLGKSGAGCTDDDSRSVQLSLLAARPELDYGEIDAFFAIDTAHLDPAARQAEAEQRLPECGAAREALWGFLDAEMTRLEALRAEAWADDDGPELAERIDRASIDTSAMGPLRHRYEAAANLNLHRCLNQLVHQRREAEHEMKARPQPNRSSPRRTWGDASVPLEDAIEDPQPAAPSAPDPRREPARNEPISPTVKEVIKRSYIATPIAPTTAIPSTQEPAPDQPSSAPSAPSPLDLPKGPPPAPGVPW